MDAVVVMVNVMAGGRIRKISSPSPTDIKFSYFELRNTSSWQQQLWGKKTASHIMPFFTVTHFSGLVLRL